MLRLHVCSLRFLARCSCGSRISDSGAQLTCDEWMRCGHDTADSLLLQVVGTMGGGKVGTHFIKRLQQGWDVKTLLYYGRRFLGYLHDVALSI